MVETPVKAPSKPSEVDPHRRPGTRVHLAGGGLGPSIVAVARRVWAVLDAGHKVVVVTPEPADADAWQDGLSFLLGDRAPVHRVPAPPPDPTLPKLADTAAAAERMGVLYALADAAPPAVLVGDAAAWCHVTVDPSTAGRLGHVVRVGGSLPRETVAAWLDEAGFRRVDLVTEPGTYALRGGLADLYVPGDPGPVRIDWFGDEVESLRRFDPATQRSRVPVDQVTIRLVAETVPTETEGLRGRIVAAADELRLPTRMVTDLVRRVESRGATVAWEALVPVLHAAAAPVFAHVPTRGVLRVAIDPPRAAAAQRMRIRHLTARVERARAGGRFGLPALRYSASEADVRAFLEAAQVTVGLPPGPVEVEETVPGGAVGALPMDLAAWRRGRIGLADALARWLPGPGDPPETVVLAAPSQRRARDLVRLLGPKLPVQGPLRGAPVLHLPAGRYVVVGRFPDTCVAGDLRVVADRDVFGPVARGVHRPRAGKGIAQVMRLRPGDHVVHRTHGVGRFEGLVRLRLRGTWEEFAKIAYAGSDKLYLPVLRVGEIEPFVGAGDRPPQLDRLGGASFARRTQKVRADVRGLAEELLRIYADRNARRRPPHPPPDAHDAAFAATFPHEETPDQRAAIEAVHEDLSGPRPMDRLVCGDVGFGKTEVALRAIFRVAASGRQVAVLAPTTVLARQHERLMEQRLAPFGLSVAGLHRFVPPARRRRLLEALRAGRVDVVVGTHRLLEKDVRFARLGLLVVDEEQRFGVRHKERLKLLRADVDVLTLSATPIPRTLHMALVGMRDVSLLSTPPPDRRAVETVLAGESDDLLADAVERELARGGQVFFVVPRIVEIEPWRRRLARLVPGARVAVAHGKMPAAKLERSMLAFVEGEADVLLCTTIAENGLDIPRANTLVVAGADRFGLAQLHQLRGRVGRSAVQAHAYFVVPDLAAVPASALARLAAVAEYSDLGAGFEVARRDLELRGAGDLLGARQSGAVAKVGFSTYARLLREAVAEIEGTVLPDEAGPEVGADVPAFLPETYVADPVLRLELYRELAAAATDADVDAAAADLSDRFGPLPPEARAFLELARWQGIARAVGAEAVEFARGRLVVRWAPRRAPARVPPGFRARRDGVFVAHGGWGGQGGGAASRADDPDAAPAQPDLAEVTEVLRGLAAYVQGAAAGS